jgi:uncharacterized protein HemX
VRSFRALAPQWPSPETRADFPTVVRADPPTVALRRRRSGGRAQTLVLVVSAFALGLALGAAAFVGVWRTTASRGDRADAARALTVRELHSARARSVRLGTKLKHTKADLAATKRQLRRIQTELRNAEGQAAAAGREATSKGAALASLADRASKVRYYVTSLEAYIQNTPSADLDTAFLQSQLAYLAAAVRRLQPP